jgi:type I restriction enzyme M protein
MDTDKKTKEILNKIIPNFETEIPLLVDYLSKLQIYEKEKGKWYIKSHDSKGSEKLVFNEEKNNSAPEEIVRQLFLFELTDSYSYPLDRIETEKSVSFGREKKRADIVIYQEDKVTPWIIVEVKAPNQKLNMQQLKSYLNAEGSPIGMGINGKEKAILYRPYPKQFEDSLPDIPTEIEYQEVKDSANPVIEVSDVILNRRWTLEELEKTGKRNYDLRGVIETLEELVLANSGVDSFTEIFKLIYAKLYDEWEAENNRPDKQLKFRKYKDPKTTYKVISDLFKGAIDEWKGIFEKTDRIKLTPEHLSVCISALQGVKLFGADLRIIDEAFEYLVPEVSKSKKGQYFTPRVIIDAAVRMLNPSRKEYIVDPACGSAGFLVHAMEYVWDKYNMKTYRTKSNYAGKFLWGIDFEERSTKISKAIMLIAGDGKSHIFQENSLEFARWSGKLADMLKEEGLAEDNNFKTLNFDILLTNPPFAGEIKEEWLKKLFSIVPESKLKRTGSAISRHILFIERALDMLRPGGRMAIVLPQGIFNNTNDKYIREFIMKRARILAVIGLHGNSFKPHTGTKTSLLFLRKWKEEELEEVGNPKIKDYPIFFAVSKIPFKDNSGNYIFVKDENGNLILDKKGNPIYQTDLFDIADAFINLDGKRSYSTIFGSRRKFNINVV